MNLTWLKIKAKTKGLFSNDIPFNPILLTGDSSPYFGNFESQRYGIWDTDLCWDFSGCELLETRFEMMEKMGLISQANLNWLIQNGYKDSDGDYYFSRRWEGILSGVGSGGNYQQNFWDLAHVAGMIPNSLLPYNPSDAYKDGTRVAFDADYFNPQKITFEMENLGKEFARRFNIQGKTMGGGYLKDISVMLQTYLKGGSLQIGIPVPQDGSWNMPLVNYPVGNTTPQHAVELYKFDETQQSPFFIYDSYEPHLKQLSANYFIPLITRVSVIDNQPVAVSQPNYWTQFWSNVAAWLSGNPLPFPSTPIGGLSVN